jgi:hAT family C-terminal dimerisation region
MAVVHSARGEDARGEDVDKSTLSVEDELNAYMHVQQVSTKVDPLLWWKQHQGEFPRLARMARQYLAVPATSASVERVFSGVGLVTTDLRGRLMDTTTIDLMWAKAVLQNSE